MKDTNTQATVTPYTRIEGAVNPPSVSLRLSGRFRRPGRHRLVMQTVCQVQHENSGPNPEPTLIVMTLIVIMVTGFVTSKPLILKQL